MEHHRDKGPLTPSGPIVAFDFDGTLTISDTFLAFLRWRAGTFGYGVGMIRLAPSAAAFLIHRKVDRLKAAAVRVFLKGAPMTLLAAEAEAFSLAAAPMLFRPDALEAWRRHRDEGARMVIVTASPEVVIAPFAQALGAERLIGTRLAVDAHDRATGAFSGPNCRGPEKVKRLRDAFGDDVRLAAAYGDTDGDTQMLEIADRKFMRLFVARPAKGADPA